MQQFSGRPSELSRKGRQRSQAYTSKSHFFLLFWRTATVALHSRNWFSTVPHIIPASQVLPKSASQKLLDEVAKDPNVTIETATLVELFADANNLSGEALQTQKQSKNDILLARGQLEKATDVFTGTKKLYDANYASTLDLKSAELDVERYRVQKESADESLRLYKLYSLPKQTMQLLSAYREAGHELRRTEARARSRMAQAPRPG